MFDLARAKKPAYLLVTLLILSMFPLYAATRSRAATSHVSDRVPFPAPVLSPITATFNRPVTTYSEVVATAPGDRLTYKWSKDTKRDCGTFGPLPTAPDLAQWFHPDAAGGGDCPDEAVHPGEITVTVTSNNWICAASYPNGSAAGVGLPPGPCVPLELESETPTPTVTATGTVTNTPTDTGTPTNTPTVTSTPTSTKVVTPTPSPTPTLTDKQIDKAYWRDASRWEKRLSTGMKGVGITVTGVGLVASATGIGAVPGLPTAAAGLAVTFVGFLAGALGDEMSFWAQDPPDMAFYMPVDVARLTSPTTPVKGLPPNVATTYNALAKNYSLQIAQLKAAMMSVDRATGADKSHSPACVAFQYKQALRDAMGSDKTESARPKLLANLIAAINSSGLAQIPAGAARMLLQNIAAHGFDKATDAYFRTQFGAAAAKALEADILGKIRAGKLKASDLNLSAALKTLSTEWKFRATPYVVQTTGHNVNANPAACKSR